MSPAAPVMSSRVYYNVTVLEKARERVSRLFDEFETVIVNTSGGKDSTVVLNLALEEAARRDRLPLDVMFIDQEAEWDATIQYVRQVMEDERVTPWWIQFPFRLSNATSETEDWLQCWNPGADWIRPREAGSLHENLIGTRSFLQVFDYFCVHYFGEKRVAQLAGLRAEESPGRRLGLTSGATYKDITWGKGHTHGTRRVPGHYTFYPIYDWTYTDVWKYIHEGGYPYCTLYDSMFQRGVPVRNMRVSNVHHETAVRSLTYLQEIEPETWDKVVGRLAGINAVKHVYEQGYLPPGTLPWMFDSWREYRDHLLDNLILDPIKHRTFVDMFIQQEAYFLPEIHDEMHRYHIAAILVNDHHGGKMRTWMASRSLYRVPSSKLKKRVMNEVSYGPTD